MYTFIPATSPICCLFTIVLLLVFLSASRIFLYFIDIFQSDFWDLYQDALLDGPIQGLVDRLKTTVLSSKGQQCIPAVQPRLLQVEGIRH